MPLRPRPGRGLRAGDRPDPRGAQRWSPRPTRPYAGTPLASPDTMIEEVGVAEGTSDERPRERLLASGPEALASAELLALVLGSGSPGRPASALAARLLERFGGIRGLAQRSPRELATEAGVGTARATAIAAALELGRRVAETRLLPGARLGGSADVFRHYHLRLRDLKRERFLALLLDGKHRLAGEILVSEGTLTASLVHPREAFAPAVRESAAALVFVHNHPSGDPAPSREDLDLTRRLVAVGDLLGVRVLDHVIVGDGRYHSFADAGRLGRAE